MIRNRTLAVALSLFWAIGTNSQAAMLLTEWMYDSTNGEFMEFTNVGSSPVDMTNWSQDDNNRTAGKHAFANTFGIIQPGESVIVTEAAEAAFRTAWNLPASVKVFGGYTNDNLGRSDEINLYDQLGGQVDRLTYNDQGSGTVAGPRTSAVSGNIPPAALGLNNASLAVVSVINDSYHSYASTGGSIGNPGMYITVPEPASLLLLLLLLTVGTLMGPRRRRNN